MRRAIRDFLFALAVLVPVWLLLCLLYWWRG